MVTDGVLGEHALNMGELFRIRFLLIQVTSETLGNPPQVSLALSLSLRFCAPEPCWQGDPLPTRASGRQGHGLPGMLGFGSWRVRGLIFKLKRL